MIEEWRIGVKNSSLSPPVYSLSPAVFFSLSHLLTLGKFLLHDWTRDTRSSLSIFPFQYMLFFFPSPKFIKLIIISLPFSSSLYLPFPLSLSSPPSLSLVSSLSLPLLQLINLISCLCHTWSGQWLSSLNWLGNGHRILDWKGWLT